MASPQLENGYCTLAVELQAALDVADFSKFDRMLLSLLLAAQYGPKKLSGLDLDPVKLGMIASCQPSSFRKAIKSLLEIGAIRRNPDHSYSIVKDWECWMTRARQRSHGALGPRIEDGDRRFVQYIAGEFGLKNRSTGKRTRGATQHLSHQSDKHGRGATEHSNSSSSGATWHSNSSSSGANGHSTSAYGSSEVPGENKDLGIRSSSTPVPPDPLRTEEIRKEERTLACSSRTSLLDLEPFMAPAPEQKPPAPRDATADALHAYMLKVTTSTHWPAGREDMADHAVHELQSWTSQRYPVEIVKSAIHKTVKKGGRILEDALAFSKYVQAILNGYADEIAARSAAPPAVLPSQTKPMTYHVAPPRPKPAAGAEGAR